MAIANWFQSLIASSRTHPAELRFCSEDGNVRMRCRLPGHNRRRAYRESDLAVRSASLAPLLFLASLSVACGLRKSRLISNTNSDPPFFHNPTSCTLYIATECADHL